jgi:hypothetical protein
MANAHSHAFQRDLRGRAERPSSPDDDFWSWRQTMYGLAAVLDPERMREVGARVYGEMAAAGYGAVGEFHYVHHSPDGTPYKEPNAMAIALAEAAVEAGLEIALLPAAYHRAGPGLAPTPGQRRFCDPTAEAFLERVDALRAWAADRAGVSVGVAAHSVRAVPADWLEAIARYADAQGLVRHVHAHEQVRELDECRAEHGCTPIELLERTGFLGPRTSVVHGIHVTRTTSRSWPPRRDRGELSDHRGQPRRRSPAGAALPRRGRAPGDRQRLAGAARPVRGGPRARDARPPRGPDAPRAALRRRRPVGRAGSGRAGRASGWTRRAGRLSRSTSTTLTCGASSSPTCRWRWRPARRPAWSSVVPGPTAGTEGRRSTPAAARSSAASAACVTGHWPSW